MTLPPQALLSSGSMTRRASRVAALVAMSVLGLTASCRGAGSGSGNPALVQPLPPIPLPPPADPAVTEAREERRVARDAAITERSQRRAEHLSDQIERIERVTIRSRGRVQVVAALRSALEDAPEGLSLTRVEAIGASWSGHGLARARVDVATFLGVVGRGVGLDPISPATVTLLERTDLAKAPTTPPARGAVVEPIRFEFGFIHPSAPGASRVLAIRIVDELELPVRPESPELRRKDADPAAVASSAIGALDHVSALETQWSALASRFLRRARSGATFDDRGIRGNLVHAGLVDVAAEPAAPVPIDRFPARRVTAQASGSLDVVHVALERLVSQSLVIGDLVLGADAAREETFACRFAVYELAE